MRILCVGDVVGRVGRQAVARLLPRLIDQHQLDLVVVNAENASGGVGLTTGTARELLDLPIDILTSGNHIWKHKELLPFLDKEPRLLRPHNYPKGAPGSGIGLIETPAGISVGVINLQGRVFMDPIDCPFEGAIQAVEQLKEKASIILVELHAEATSEKRAMGWFLDQQVSAVYGTHTHVATADEEILPGGTAYITDIGMTGPYDSIIGMRKQEIIKRFVTMRPTMMTPAKKNVRLCGIILDIDPENGRASTIQRINKPLIDES